MLQNQHLPQGHARFSHSNYDYHTPKSSLDYRFAQHNSFHHHQPKSNKDKMIELVDQILYSKPNNDGLGSYQQNVLFP